MVLANSPPQSEPAHWRLRGAFNGRPAPAAAALQVELDGLRAELDRVSRQAAAQQAEVPPHVSIWLYSACV